MKLYKYALAVVMAASATAFVSCDNDFDRPPVIVPEATIEANASISELKEAYWNDISSNTYTTVPVNADGDSIVIAGTVISSDESGNIYKGLYLRDETGVMYFRVNAYDIYQSYQVGQEVRINVTGLLIGGYGRAPQMGTLYNGSVGQIDENEFKIRAQRNGLPVSGSVTPEVTTIADLNSYKNNTADLQKWMFQLVQINDVTFQGGGSQLWTDKPGDTGSTSRTLTDASGNTIICYTSNKSTFASDVLPKGTGSVTAILSYYNGTWQLLVMDPKTDCQGFEFVDSPSDTPDVPSGDVIFSESFATSLGKFTVNNVNAPAEVPEIWKNDSKYGYAIATAYVNSTNYASESWLISPVIDLTGETAAYLSYEQALNFFTDLEVAKTQATVNIREEGSSSWTKLTVPVYPAALNWNFAATGSIDLSAYVGKKVEIGFCYTSTATKAGTWELKNVVISTEGTPSTPSTPDTPSDGSIFSESFATSLGQFTTDDVKLSPALSYVWSFASGYGAKASAFVGGANQEAESWLISPSINLAGHTGVTLAFEHTANYLNGTPFASCCSVFVGEAGTDKSTWTDLTPNVKAPAGNNWTFVNSGDLSLAAFEGKSIQIAFRYMSTSSVAPTWEVKNLIVK